MAIYLRQQLNLEFFGDGTATSFSFDLSKPPVNSDPHYSGNEGPLAIGTPSQVEAVTSYYEAPQVGNDQFGQPVLDKPAVVPSLVGTVLTLTFTTAPLAFGSTFTDLQNNQWPINTPYGLELFFDYNSVA